MRDSRSKKSKSRSANVNSRGNGTLRDPIDINSKKNKRCHLCRVDTSGKKQISITLPMLQYNKASCECFFLICFIISDTISFNYEANL